MRRDVLRASHESSCCCQRVQSEEGLESPVFLRLLRALIREGDVANMPVENLLAEIKTACGYSKMKPNYERLCFLGRLAQAMKLHVKCGGNDNRKLTRDDVLKRGIPVRAAAAGKSARNKKTI